ncbi:MAG: nucleotidyltransferase family protein [Polyangiaceae bacterium]|nr:nucleotidyltransferase family protein [Polyangiaceae bacterium]
MGRIIPFNPPALLPTGELDWVLGRAFGPPEAHRSVSAPRDKAAALRLANALGLGPVIAHRTAASMLEAELGSECAAALARALLAQVAHGLKRREVLVQFCAAAASARRTVVLLKHAALDALGLAGPSTRSAVDIDVLVRSSDIDEIAEAATRAGFVRRLLWPSSLHPLVLLSPGPHRIPVECHVYLPNVRLAPDAQDATVDSLEGAGLLGPVSGLASSAQVPADHMIASHLLAHALVQHRFTPAYGPMRLLVDGSLIGLDVHEGLAERALRPVAHCVDAGEFEALVELLVLLRRGASLAQISEHAGPARLLAHVVHASANRLYADSLAVARQRQRLHDEGLMSWLSDHARTAFMRKVRGPELQSANTEREHAPRSLREPLRSAAQFARGLVASTRLWLTRSRRR